MMAAVYQTDCAADCGHVIRPGDDIEMDDRGDWVHLACSDPFAAMPDPQPEPEDEPAEWELKPHETVCLVCFLVKPCDCEEA